MGSGSIWWSECVTADIEAAKKHYGAVCGWSFEGMPMPNGTYWVAKKGDKTICGLMELSMLEMPEGIPAHWMTYIAVADLDAAVANATDTGGTIVQPPFEIPGVGRIAMVKEPGGALAGIIQPPDSALEASAN